MNQQIQFKLADLEIPIQVIRERRRNARAAFGKDAILLRIPSNSGVRAASKHIEWAKSWLLQTYKRKPKVFERYRPVNYNNDQIIVTNYRTYNIKLVYEDRKSPKGIQRDKDIQIALPHHFTGLEKEIGKIVSHYIGQDHHSWIKRRVNWLNTEHFQEKVQRVNLRYAETRWGSCSNNGNISISTRALLAPVQILDHIIIHELAHLKELNHSAAFWQWVSKADPNYREHDKWLRNSGYKLKF